MDSYADVLCPDYDLNTGCPAAKVRGTRVMVGNHPGPVYEIVHVEGETAWLRQPVTFRGECLVPLSRLRAIGDIA